MDITHSINYLETIDNDLFTLNVYTLNLINRFIYNHTHLFIYLFICKIEVKNTFI